MKPQCHQIFPPILEISEASFDDEGFWPTSDHGGITRWHEIEEVCCGHWIHTIAIVDFTFHGVRTRGDGKSVWVLDENNQGFLVELRNRFPHATVPDFVKWDEPAHCIQTFTIWPQELFGNSMYETAKKAWYSSPGLAYRTHNRPLLEK